MATYQHKGADRNYYRITLDDVDGDGENLIWSYRIEVSPHGEGGWERVWVGEIVGQYDLPPSVEDVLREFSAQVTAFAITWAFASGYSRSMPDSQ